MNLKLFTSTSATVAKGSDVAGLPTSILGKPVAYLWKDIARVGDFTHNSTGQQFTFSVDRFDQWVEAFDAMKANGTTVYVPSKHPERTGHVDARDNLGYVLKLSRDGERLRGMFQLIGQDAIDAASRNSVSVGVYSNVRDNAGKIHAQAIEHVALVPNPIIHDLGEFRLAASRAGLSEREELLAEVERDRESDRDFVERVQFDREIDHRLSMIGAKRETRDRPKDDIDARMENIGHPRA